MIELAGVPMFAGLTAVQLARLAGELREETRAAGTVLFRHGEAGDCFYIVRAGVAEARTGQDDADYPLAVFEAGDTFGEMALLTDEPRSTTIVALTELQLWSLPKGRFRALVEQVPSLALAVARLLSRRLQATNQAVSSMHRSFDAAAEQAYAGLDPELQRFLTRTSPLDPLSPDLVARALGRPDAGQVLAYLAARLPFVTVDDAGRYRYHRLFRELLEDKLSVELGAAARRDWVGHLAECAVAVGEADQAVRLLLAAGEDGRAEELAVARSQTLIGAQQFDQLEQLLASLPPALADSRGELADVRAELMVARGRPGEAVALLERASHPDDGAIAPEDDAHRARRYRRLAELNFELGRPHDGLRWLERTGDGQADGDQAIGELGQLGAGPRNGRQGGGSAGGLRALGSLAGLRRASGVVGTLGGRGVSRPLGAGLSLAVLAGFFLTAAPEGLSREAYLALGLLAAALPLLIFSVLGDHLIMLLMVAGWAGLGLVPARVALSGFATPGWFLVLAVLGVGVALARVGLLYRLVLSLLVRLPANHVVITLALAGAGLVFSPAMPNATARTALAAPLVLEVADALGYGRRSRGSAAIGLAVLLGFGQMCTLFLTGSSSGLLVHSLLPAESRARFGWGNWFLAALPLHIVIFLITYVAILVLLRPRTPPARSTERLEAQRRILGPPGKPEIIAGLVFVLLVLAFLFGPLIGLDPAWAAVLAMVTLGATGVLDQQGFKGGINWAFLIFFGAMLSLAEVFSELQVDAWLAAAAARPLAPLAANPAIFLMGVGLTGYLLNLVVRWQAACVLMTLVLVPVAAPLGIEPWIVGLTALVTTNMWFLPYQSTIYQALYYGTDEQAFTHAQVRPIALVYGVACLLGLAASVPVWQAMGMMPR